MPLVLPLLEQIVAGQPRKPKPIHDSFQSIVDKFNANIVDADVNSAANISGSKLGNATIVGSDKLADGTVTTSKLETSTSTITGVTTAKIADTNVTTAKLAALAVTSAKLAMTIHVVAFTISSFTAYGVDLDSEVGSAAVNPTSSFAKATYDLVGCYVKTLTGSFGVGGVIAMYADDSGTNWAGTVRVIRDAAGSGNISGSAVYVFMQKV